MGKKRSTRQRKRGSKRITAVLLTVLTILLVFGICFAGKMAGGSDEENTVLQDNPPAAQETELAAFQPTQPETEAAAAPAGEPAETAEPPVTEPEIPPEAPNATEPVEEPETAGEPEPPEQTDATEATEQGEPVYQELQIIEQVPDYGPVLETRTFTKDEEYILLQISMAEVGCEECVECAALVMRTVLNRMESRKFPNTMYGVIYAWNQFTPVWSGSFYSANPNDICVEALELIRSGWDESQGALYYEACTDGSWHSRQLDLLYQHCNTRWYK